MQKYKGSKFYWSVDGPNTTQQPTIEVMAFSESTCIYFVRFIVVDFGRGIGLSLNLF